MMATLTACQHSAQKNAVQRHQCTQTVAEYVYVASPLVATRAATSAPSSVVEYVAQAPDVTNAAPARVAYQEQIVARGDDTEH